MLGSPQAPRGRTASFSFTVMSARDAGSYFCQAQNNVSKETSEPKTFSLDGPPPTQDPPPAPAGEQHAVYGNVTWQDEDEEADTYPSDLAVLREPEARPAEPASRTWGMSVICTEVRCSRLADVPATRPKTRSRTHEAPPTLGTSRKPCTTDGTAPAPPTAASSAPQGASGDPNPSASP
ncbi:Fc receptor-like protein 6 isoform X1 [Canis lupus familiaris]|uniref:Fc receptor-like protein 6 isoform X1 n=1 Tax=Canis lupus familiaris TaxID=9615 RepID=UPI0018F7E055|nr:Fc receptor-like protein 6 isoform X1 [Canis lupus familiaris]XP_038304647.1 Fc receptor-like protein 6 isoform X1 [Canis lupus familiaris]